MPASNYDVSTAWGKLNERRNGNAQSVNARIMLQLRSLSCVELLAHAPSNSEGALVQDAVCGLATIFPLARRRCRPLKCGRSSGLWEKPSRGTVSHQALAGR